MLGTMYDFGRSVPQDYIEAAKWYRRAADRGNWEAQLNLGASYAKGTGFSQDFVQAHKWFNLAAAGESDEVTEMAVQNRDIVARKLTREQISEAQRLAREWKSDRE